jgi:hypothetical protein
VLDNRAQYNKATTKIDCNVEAVKIIMAGHSLAKANIAEMCSCELDVLV